MTSTKVRERGEAIETLRSIFKDANARKDRDGATIYVNITHVSASGMQRRMRLYNIDGTRLAGITYLASKALGWPMDHRGIKVDGCGMDMAFHLVYTLSSVLFGHEAEGGYRLAHETI